MSSNIPSFLVLAITVTQCACSCMRPKHMPNTVFGRPTKGGLMGNILDEEFNSVKDTNDSITIGYITQKLDNFDLKNTATWKQRYMYNSIFNSGKSLAFLMIGGESIITKKWIKNENYTWLVWAKKYGAAAFQVEHRYYGTTHPLPTMSTNDYRFFTIDQALADTREFILQMNTKYANELGPAPIKWVVFGGSYPGSLAAWFRALNPDITIGAVSSSSAVDTEVDYYGYAMNVEWTLNQVDPKCASNVGVAFQQMEQMVLNVEGRKNLVEKLNLCPAFDEKTLTNKDIQFFLSNFYGLFQGINQYTGDNRDPSRQAGLGVPKACDIMTNDSIGDYIDRINAVQDFYNSFYPQPNGCNPNSYKAYMEELKNLTYDPPYFEMAAARGWTWQCCTELGYFQTTDGGNGIFGTAVPLDFFVDQCVELFGKEFDITRTRKGAAETRTKYGGSDNYKGTKCVFPNGSFDPWKSLGYSKNNTKDDVYAILIDGTAHCADMYPASETMDKPSLIKAREFLGEHLDSFIKKASTPFPMINSTTTNLDTSSIVSLISSSYSSRETKIPITLEQSPSTKTSVITTTKGAGINYPLIPALLIWQLLLLFR